MSLNVLQERQQAHAYLDRLPPAQLSAVRSLLETMLPDTASLALANAPVEDEQISEEEEQAVARFIRFRAHPTLATAAPQLPLRKPHGSLLAAKNKRLCFEWLPFGNRRFRIRHTGVSTVVADLGVRPTVSRKLLNEMRSAPNELRAQPV